MSVTGSSQQGATQRFWLWCCLSLFFPPQPPIWGVPFRWCNMVSSAKLALFAFLQSMRSISLGRNLKAFILRCVLLWPRILRSLRKVWLWYFQTSSRDEKKTKGDTGGPSSPGTTGKREEYVVVCASQAFGGMGGPSRHSVLRSSDAEQSTQLEDGIPRNPSMPHPLPSSYALPQQDPPWLPATTHPSGSPHTSVRSFRTGSSVNSRSNAPVPWTHSRATAGQFTGTSSRRSRPSSPSRRRPNTPTRPDPHISTPPTMTHDSEGHPEDSTSVSIQLSPRDRSPFRRHFSRPNTPMSPDIENATRPPGIQHSQGSSTGDSASGVVIGIEPPSRSASLETTESMHSISRPRVPSLDDFMQSSPTSHQRPSTEPVNSSAVSSDLRGHSPSMSRGYIGAQDSKESIQDPLTSQPTQTPQITFSEPSTSRKLTKISTTNDVTQQTPSVPHARTSPHAPSPQDSPKLPATQLPLGSPHTSASSLRAESPRHTPVHGQIPSLLTPYPFPSTEYTNSSAVSSHSRGHGLMMHRVHTGAHQSTGSFQDSVTIQSFQAPFRLQPEVMFPEPFAHRPLTSVSMTNASNSSFRPDTHPVRPMHSDQVSRYVKKGDV